MARREEGVRIKPAGWLVLILVIAGAAAYLLQPKLEPQYVASSQTNVYHRLNCRYVAEIKPDHRQFFQTPAEAEKSGHRPCQVCRP